MKLPNGFGSVNKLSGKRRNPYAAVKTVGWEITEDGRAKQKLKYIGYYATRKEALQALAEYNANPLQTTKVSTFAELYEKWADKEYRNCSVSFKRVYQAAYKALTPLYDMQVANLTLDDFQAVVDSCGKNKPTLKKVRSLVGKMYDYAIMLKLVTQAEREMVNHIDIRSAENPNNIDRVPFSDKEINKLWEIGEPAHGILVMLYTGLRVGEFAELRTEDVHLSERWLFVRKAKTKAGVRIVPIADKIVPILEHYQNKNNEFMFADCLPAVNGKVSYFKWEKLMGKIGMKHHPHDCRHTLVSALIAHGVNVTLVKNIVGHASGDVTEDVYAHSKLKEMLVAINKI